MMTTHGEDETPDRTLVAAAQTGDGAAFLRLMARYRARLEATLRDVGTLPAPPTSPRTPSIRRTTRSLTCAIPMGSIRGCAASPPTACSKTSVSGGDSKRRSTDCVPICRAPPTPSYAS